MIEARRGLIVEIGDGDFLSYRQTIFYDLVKMNVNRLAFAMAHELRTHRVAAVTVTPGYMRTEVVLEHHGVTEANWKEAAKKDPFFAFSETPFFVGRAVAALAADPRVLVKSGGLFGSWTLSDEYGFADVDGNRPHWGRSYAKATRRKSPWPPSNLRYAWSVTAA
jgi:NAD(P)-dependent dehydrogenase (short-subunit alcohol dehydrogenase family)